jgi:RNA polymerase sigma-70 factor (ECF subfamily)
VLATLIRQVGDFDLAEDAVQDAFADALATWPRDGVPANVGAWITVAARRRAIDRLRRGRSRAALGDRLAELVRLESQENAAADDDSAVGDDRLRLIFTCCHPALDVQARAALTFAGFGRTDHGRDRAGVSGQRADDGQADRPGQTEDR